MAINVLRGSLEGVSVSLFRMLQDTQDLIQVEETENKKNASSSSSSSNNSNNKADVDQWHQLSERMIKEKEQWLANQTKMLAQWDAIEQALLRTARASNVELESTRANDIFTKDGCDGCSSVLNRHSVGGNDAGSKAGNRMEEIQRAEPDKHISVFEAVATKVPRMMHHQRRSKISQLTSSSQKLRVNLTSELSTVLTNREQLPELVRNVDRSGWSELQEIQSSNTKDKEESVLISSNEVKDHLMNSDPTALFRAPNPLMSQLFSAVQQKTQTEDFLKVHSANKY
jgi:hypothetical protein